MRKCEALSTSENTFSLAQSSRSGAVQQFIDDPVLAPGFSTAFTNDDQNRTPFAHSLARGTEATAIQILSVTNDEALNRLDLAGQSALWYAIYREHLDVLQALLRRPNLDMNNCSESIYRDFDHVESFGQQRIMYVFDQAAALFADVPHLIHETVYGQSRTTLPLPICDIIFNYYRKPYPIKELSSLEPLATKA